LAEALRKVADLIRAIELYAESTDAPKKAKALINRNVGRGDRRPRLEIVDPHFTIDPRSILMEVKEHPMLKRPQPMISAPKPHIA